VGGDALPRRLVYAFVAQGAISLVGALIAIGFVFLGPAEHRPMAIALAVLGIGTAGSLLLVARGMLSLIRRT
jgi:hypothetical protein